VFVPVLHHPRQVVQVVRRPHLQVPQVQVVVGVRRSPAAGQTGEIAVRPVTAELNPEVATVPHLPVAAQTVPDQHLKPATLRRVPLALPLPAAGQTGAPVARPVVVELRQGCATVPHLPVAAQTVPDQHLKPATLRRARW